MSIITQTYKLHKRVQIKCSFSVPKPKVNEPKLTTRNWVLASKSVSYLMINCFKEKFLHRRPTKRHNT